MADENPQQIIIIGAGLGGLVLAMGLKRAGLPVTVFEKDASATERNQGYYNRYSQFGRNALKSLVSESILQEMEVSANPLLNESPDVPFQYQFISADAKRDMPVPLPPAPNPLVKSIRDPWIWIRRDTFRNILIRELEDQICWGHQFASYELTGSSVTAIFSNGARVEGRLLVGADGASSRVAMAMNVPPPYTSKSEMISGLVRNTPELVSTLDRRQLNVLSFTTDYTTNGPMPCGGDTALQMVQSETSPVTTWIVAAIKGFGPELGGLSKPELAETARAAVKDFAPSLTRAVEATQDEDMIQWKLRIRSEVPQWTTQSRLTLLGDACHSMSPGGGNGANMAFVSASMLLKALLSNPAKIGEDIDMIKEYEDSMRTTADMILAGVKQLSKAVFGMDYE